MSVHRTEQHPILSAQEKWRKLLKHKEQICTAPLPVVCEGGNAPSALHHLMKEKTHVGAVPVGELQGMGEGRGCMRSY